MGWPAPSFRQSSGPRKKTEVRHYPGGNIKNCPKSESNANGKLYYELLWEIGAPKPTGANLTAANIDWNKRLLSSFHRQKNGILKVSRSVPGGDLLKNSLRKDRSLHQTSSKIR